MVCSHTADSAGTNLVAVTDATALRVTSLAYLPSHSRPVSRTMDGKRTEYTFDYRFRQSQSRTWSSTTASHISMTNYWQNKLFFTQDPYGRREYYGYSASNASELIRRVQFNFPGGTFNNPSEVVTTVTRDQSPNAPFIVVDAIKDSEGNLLETIDGRGISAKHAYDSRERETVRRDAEGTPVEARTETFYDKSSNVVEVRSPRFFDSSDPHAANMKSLFTYTGRELQASQTLAAGAGSAQAVTSQTWTLEGKTNTRTDAGGNVWTSAYDNSCCGQYVGQKDPLGHGSLTNSDAMGRAVHSAVVSEFDLAVGGSNGSLDPADGKTLGESTTRYDNLGRSVARTQWLLPRGLIDRNNPPIAGLDGIAVDQGITSQTYYDANMKDNAGLDSTAGMPIRKLGGGTYNLSLTAVMAQAAAAESAGGAATSFQKFTTPSAVVSIGPDETISVSVSDGMGRSLISAQLQPWNGPQPFALVAVSGTTCCLPTRSGDRSWIPARSIRSAKS